MSSIMSCPRVRLGGGRGRNPFLIVPQVAGAHFTYFHFNKNLFHPLLVYPSCPVLLEAMCISKVCILSVLYLVSSMYDQTKRPRSRCTVPSSGFGKLGRVCATCADPVTLHGLPGKAHRLLRLPFRCKTWSRFPRVSHISTAPPPVFQTPREARTY
jgi:hypothetical protein